MKEIEKDAQKHGMISQVHGLEELMWSKCLHYSKQSTDLTYDPYQNISDILHRTWKKKFLKFVRNHRKSQIDKAFSEKSKVGGITLCDYKAIVMKTSYHGHENRHTGQ